MTTDPKSAEPVAPFLELARVLKEYDAISDPMSGDEDDFVMRAADWRVLRATFDHLTSRPAPSAASGLAPNSQVEGLLAQLDDAAKGILLSWHMQAICEKAAALIRSHQAPVGEEGCPKCGGTGWLHGAQEWTPERMSKGTPYKSVRCDCAHPPKDSNAK